MYIHPETSDISHSRRVGEPELGKPTPQDGLALNNLVAASPPLDRNSVYCNLLQCSHFSDTAIAAKLDGQLIGFVSAYWLPARPDTLFIWQVVIAETYRGRGLAKRMVLQLVRQLPPGRLHFIETTITEDNQASWRLFRGIARELCGTLESLVLFDRDRHFGGQHQDEYLLQIGPLGVKP